MEYPYLFAMMMLTLLKQNSEYYQIYTSVRFHEFGAILLSLSDTPGETMYDKFLSPEHCYFGLIFDPIKTNYRKIKKK
jgi:hypothetical protein